MMLGKFPFLPPVFIFLKQRHNISHQEEQLCTKLEAIRISLGEQSNIFLHSGHVSFFLFGCARLQLMLHLGHGGFVVLWGGSAGGRGAACT